MRVISKQENSEFTEFTKKFSFPDRPGVDMPDLPECLDDLSEADLMEVYREFMAWLAFAKAELVKAEISEEREATLCRVVESRVLIEQWSAEAKGDRVTIAKARRDIDPKVIEQQEVHRKSRAYRKLVESVFDRYDRGSQLLSRELTRRVSGSPREGRNARFNP